MAEAENLSLTVAWDVIDATTGFACDIGGSVAKLIYLKRDEYVSVKDREKEQKGCLHMKVFQRDNIQPMLDFIKHNVYVYGASEAHIERKLFSTGFGGNEYSKQLKQSLGMGNETLSEIDCFVYGVNYLLQNYNKQEIVHPLNERVKQRVEKQVKVLVNVAMQFGAEVPRDNKPTINDESVANRNGGLITEEENIFPYLVAMCGSGVGTFLVFEDGSFIPYETTNRGGKCLLGLGSLLTQYKDFDEFLELCEKGNADNVSITSKDLADNLKNAEDDQENIYAAIFDDDAPFTPFCFGKAAGKTIGDFNREDLARCLLETLMYDLSQFAYFAAKILNARHVFFCGGLVSHPVVRDILCQFFLRISLTGNTLNPEMSPFIHHHIMKHSQYVGVLGAFLNHKFQWSKKGKPPPAGTKQIKQEKPPTDAKQIKINYKNAVGF